MILLRHRGVEIELETILLGLRPNLNFVAGPLDVNDVGIAANRAIFDVLLAAAGGWIEWNHNLFTTAIAEIGGFVFVVVFGFVGHDKVTAGARRRSDYQSWTRA